MLQFVMFVGASALALVIAMATGHLSGPFAATLLAGAIALMVAAVWFVLMAQNSATIHAAETQKGGSELFLSDSSEAAFVVGDDGKLCGGNAHFAALAAVDHQEIAGCDISDVLPGPIVEAMTLALEHGLDSTGAIECENRVGEWLIVEVARRHGVAAATHEFAFVMRDLTEIRRREIELATLAFQDPLTHLGNRAAVTRRLARLADDLAEGPEASFAVMALDLDRFKQINDQLGHMAGDALLIEVAARIAQAVPRNAFVGRNGGDEFVVVAGPRATYASARQIAQQIVETVSRPIALKAGPVEVGVSIGVAFAPAHGETTDRLLEAADAAMYRAKRACSGYAFADDEPAADMKSVA
ncbi:GGDEF domain-containing protein [Terrarubrum flagellatum]|uniref:GGDEF domain-containing protein n=1 Tax=Terrirubrum flagellatum TaxID=2895980 RepID=UPI00314521DB